MRKLSSPQKQGEIAQGGHSALAPLQHWDEELEALKKLVDTLHRELEHTREASRRKSEFLVNLNHELRNPLSAILGYSEMMYDSRQDVTERMGCIGRIRQNLKQVTELLDDIADLSRIETGQIDIHREQIHVLQELGNLFSDRRSRAWKKRLTFSVDFRQPLPEFICTDPVRFRQVVAHLLDRAMKDTERGGIYVTVRAEKSSQDARLFVSVSDTGNGIAAEKQEDVFDPFPHEESNLSTLHGGIILGLALARRVAQALGGDVTLDRSDLKKGAAFTFSVGVGSVENGRWLEQITDADLAVVPAFSQGLSGNKLDGMKLLLVEDAPDIQVLVAHFLRRK